MKSCNSFFAKIIFVLILTFLTGSSVHAQRKLADNLDYSKVLFVGIDEDNRLVFELQLVNLPEKTNVLRIFDWNKNILFEERINARTYSRRYKIDRNEIDQIYFEVINKQALLKERFQLNCRMEEKWEVVKG